MMNEGSLERKKNDCQGGNDGGTNTNSRGRIGTSRTQKSRSPVRQSNNSKSPMRMRKKNPAAMTVIVNRCDLWDNAAHFQPDEFFPPQNQVPAALALPYRFESGQVIQPSPPPGIERQEEAKFMSVTTARVPHHVESIQFPIKTNDGRPEGQHRCGVIDNTTPNPHDPNVVHDKYWAQRR